MTSVDQEIASNRRKLTEVLCKLGQNPVGDDYELKLQHESNGQWTYQLHRQDGTTTMGKAIWTSVLIVHIHGSRVHIKFNNNVEPISLKRLDKRKIRKSFILGRYITVLRPLEELLAPQQAVAELTEWTTYDG